MRCISPASSQLSSGTMAAGFPYSGSLAKASTCQSLSFMTFPFDKAKPSAHLRARKCRQRIFGFLLCRRRKGGGVHRCLHAALELFESPHLDLAHAFAGESIFLRQHNKGSGIVLQSAGLDNVAL